MLELRIIRVEMGRYERLVLLGVSCKHGRDHGNADTASEVSHQVENPRRIAHLRIRQSAHCKGGQRHEDEPIASPIMTFGTIILAIEICRFSPPSS